MYNPIQSLQAKRARSAINITPLIDVLFILIIFFMVSSTFLEQPAIQLELPQAKTAEATQLKDIVITISKDGLLFINRQQVTVEKLPAILKQAAGRNRETTVILRADKKADYGTVIRVIDLVRISGLKKVVAVTTPAEK